MKKILLFILSITFLVGLGQSQVGCKKQRKVDLMNYVSFSRSDIFVGEYKGEKIYSYYETVENPRINDGIVGAKSSRLIFTISSEILGDLSLEYDGFTTPFKYDEKSSKLVAIYPIENFDLVEFHATVRVENERESVKFSSILPSDTLTVNKALEKFLSAQETFLLSHFYGGEFNGEITVKVSVFNGKVYYLLGVADKKDNYTAFLLDGITGELLSVKNVY